MRGRRTKIRGSNFVVALDQHGRQCGPGAEGELYLIAGSNVLNALQDGLKRGRSISQIVDDARELTLIPTGLMGRQHRDGWLQLAELARGATVMAGKLIGFDTIEAHILRLDAVSECVVTMRLMQGEPKLLAYASLTHPGALTEQDIKDSLAQQLPGVMMPDYYVLLPRLPIDPFGAVDMGALRNIPVFDEASLSAIRAEQRRGATRVEVRCVDEPPPWLEEHLLHVDDLGSWAVTAADLVLRN